MTTPPIDLSDKLIQRQTEIERNILGMAVCGNEPKKGHIMEHLSFIFTIIAAGKS